MKRSIVLLFLFCACAGAAFSQTNVEPPLITVTGNAEVRVPPDEVLFTLEIENVDKDMLAANKKTDDAVKQVLSISRKHNVKPEDVQTSYISVEPKYNWDDMSSDEREKVKRVFVGYVVSKTTAIRLRDISRFDEMLADVLKAGITRLRNVEFRNSQIRKHRDQARVMAIRAAREKADLLAREIGQTIGAAYSISESGDRFDRRLQNSTTTISGDLSDSDSAIAPGSISVTAQVTVSFRLQP